jgi:hypothetical protein
MRLPLLIALVACGATCSAASGPAGVDCVGVTVVGTEPAGPESSDIRQKIRLTNNCPEDITAFATMVRLADGTARAKMTTDWLVRLAYQSHPELLRDAPDLFRRNTSTDLDLDIPGPDPYSARVIVTAVAFLDRTAAGDPKEIASIERRRTEQLATLQEEYDLLERLTDYKRALELLRGQGLSVSEAVNPLCQHG